MSDEQLRMRLQNWVLYGDVCAMGGSTRGEPYHFFAHTDTLRFWAVQPGESEAAASKRAPDYAGNALIDAIRELRGIWRPL